MAVVVIGAATSQVSASIFPAIVKAYKLIDISIDSSIDGGVINKYNIKSSVESYFPATSKVGSVIVRSVTAAGAIGSNKPGVGVDMMGNIPAEFSDVSVGALPPSISIYKFLKPTIRSSIVRHKIR